jgi:hypothetical protein
MSQPNITITRPEWIEIGFESGDWKVIYHGEALVGVGSPDYAMAQVLWYLGSEAYQQNQALGQGGQARFTATEKEMAYGSSNFDLFYKYADSNTPEVLTQAEYMALVASVTPTKFGGLRFQRG